MGFLFFGFAVFLVETGLCSAHFLPRLLGGLFLRTSWARHLVTLQHQLTFLGSVSGLGFKAPGLKLMSTADLRTMSKHVPHLSAQPIPDSECKLTQSFKAKKLNSPEYVSCRQRRSHFDLLFDNLQMPTPSSLPLPPVV